MLICLDKGNKVDIVIQAHDQNSLLRVSLRIWVLSNIEQIPCLNGNDDSFKAQTTCSKELFFFSWLQAKGFIGST
jgi:hypothetical protein